MANTIKKCPKYIILIVDDNPANLGVLSDFLDDAGFEVWAAKSGKTALELVKYDIPDLILLDVMMPEIDGFTVCQQLKTNPKSQGVPVIFMTALTDGISKVKGLNLGAVDYITKPFQQEEVLARIQLHLKLYTLTKQLAEQNLSLEQRVAERTDELHQTIEHLKQTQVQLIQSEKMSSLGQLVTGIAHEINNPVNFISGNLLHAETYIQQVLELLQLYQTDHPQPSQVILNKINDFDLEFLVEDLPKLISSMKIGADRILEIVRSLRNFSRLDGAEVRAVDIHEGINSTLMILHNRLKAKPNCPEIKVVQEYGELPLVECYLGPLNQVFMNILINAIDAIEEQMQKLHESEAVQNSAVNPTIKIQTTTIAANCVEIRIADNGPGITEAVQAQLFNPFFTTKPVGKGTGIGLAISYSIVAEKHGGKLRCWSEPGKGTEFIIQIPTQQSVASPSQDLHRTVSNY